MPPPLRLTFPALVLTVKGDGNRSVKTAGK
jgi:hypothetical protein